MKKHKINSNRNQSHLLRNKTLSAQHKPTSPKEPELLGWLIYRVDTDEFLHAQLHEPDRDVNAYTKEPCLAHVFSSERLAVHYLTFIDHPVETVPLYDAGNKLHVDFEQSMSWTAVQVNGEQ